MGISEKRFNVKKSYMFVLLVIGIVLICWIYNKQKEQHIINIEDMKQELNAFNEDKLLGTWESFFVLDSPIDSPVKYIDSVESSDGDVPAVVKCLKATYRLSEMHDITLFIIQDNTFENGGLVFSDVISEKDTVVKVYKYKKIYMSISYSDSNNRVEIEKFIDDFIDYVSQIDCLK